MFKKSGILLLIVMVFSLYSLVNGDTLALRNGLTLEGKFKGASEKTIKFEISGKVQEIAISEVKSITFAPPPAQPKSATASGSAAVAAKAGTVAEIPAGTKLLIKTTGPISTAQNGKGSTVEAVLETDLKVNGVVVAPKGSKVYGTVVESIGGRRIGLQRIMINFDRLVIDGQPVPVNTGTVGAEGGRGAAAKMVGAGALIGAAAGDAGKGAAVGAGLALLAGGRHIQIPAGTKIELKLMEPVKLK